MPPLLNNNNYDILIDSIEYLIVHQGIFAPILVIILEEAGVPLPMPGDFITAYTGYQVSQGLIPYYAAFLITLISALVGSSILYYLSRRYGQTLMLRFGKYIHMNEKKLFLLERQFKKYGAWVIVFGRHIPGLRIPVTIFSGMSDIPYGTFIFSTFFSSLFGISFYLSIGQKLGPKTIRLLHGHPSYYFFAFIPLLIFTTIILILRFRKSKKKGQLHHLKK